MSDMSALFDDHYNTLTAKGGAPKGPATWGEIWDANWNNAKLDTALGTREVLGNTLEEMKGAIAARTLQQFPDVVEQVTGSRDMAGNRAWEAKVLTAYAQSLPEEQRAALPFLDPQAEAEKRAAQTQRDAADVSARSGYGGAAVGFAAEAAASIVDPVNLATVVATAPLGGVGALAIGGRGLLKFAAREFAANAAGQALQEPFVQAGRASLGLSYGFSEALGNIAFAGAAGAALHPVVYLKAGAAALRARGLIGNAAEAAGQAAPPITLKDGEAAPAPARPDAPAPASPPMREEAQPNLFADITAADLEAAARHSAANAMVDGHAATPNDIAAMAKLLPDVRAALDTGKALPDVLPDFTPAPLTRHVVTDADGRALEVQPVIVEASALRSSADAGYDQSLQPRDRTRAASDIQIAEIAGNLNPERLGFSAEADRGAPIIAPDNMVESGNGRITAIRMAYEQNGEAASRYRGWLSNMGVDIASFKEPVLVRMRVTELAPEERAKFVVAANKATTLDFSASERALNDARMLQGGALDMIQNAADLNAAANRPFITAFMKALPTTEAAGMVTAEGKLSTKGLSRIKDAIAASAYGDSAVLARIAESTDDEIKSISNAMQAVAPEWAKMRSLVEAGNVPPEIDITKQLINAANIVADLRANSEKVQDFLGQIDLINPRDPVLDALVREFYVFKKDGTTRAASQKHITEFLKAYAREGQKIEAATGLDLGVSRMDNQTLLDWASQKARKNDTEAAAIAADAAARGLADGQGNAAGRGSDGQPGQGGGGQGARSAGNAGDAAAKPETASQTAQSLKPDAAAEAARLADMQAAIGKYGDLLTIPDAAGNDLPAQSVFDKLARTKEAGAELLDCLTKGGGA